METVANVLLVAIFLAVLAGYVVFWLRTWQDVQRADLDPSTRGFWALAILVFQLFGPLAWWWAPARDTAPSSCCCPSHED